MSAVEELMALEAKSNDFVNGLDRSRLGRFAVPIEALLMIDTLERIDKSIVSESPEGKEFYGERHDRTKYFYSDSKPKMQEILSELFFWWKMHNDPLWAIIPEWDLNLNEESLRLLELYYTHPDMHDFFDAGIWDISFIARCIADGVDVEMATSFVTDRIT